MTSSNRLMKHDPLLDVVFDESGEAMLITDEHGTILDVNRAFELVTGYTRADVIGQNPRLMKSNVHPPNFFVQMWRTILTTGRWQGEVWDRKKSGELFVKWLTIRAVTDDEGVTKQYVGVFRDATQERQDRAWVKQSAYYDPLTGLPNRVVYVDQLERAVIRAERNGIQAAAIILDLDHFKRVNDTLGHRRGDLLLKAVGQRLGEVLIEHGTVARFGGDEFALILPSVKTVVDATGVARRVLGVFEKPFTIGGREVFLSASMGISLFPFDGRTGALVKNAEKAMYAAKSGGKNRYQFYSAKMHHRAMERLELESELRRGFAQEQLRVFYQPQLDLHSQQVVGMEALARWQHPTKGLLAAGDFIPIAEEMGFIADIGEWILRQSAADCARLIAETGQAVRVWVNVTGTQLGLGTLPGIVSLALEQSGLESRYLGLELTEGTMMADTKANTAIFSKLSEMGVELSVDDFGTGYSSLAYLKRFPLGHLKIPAEFIAGLCANEDDQAITAAIVAMAGRLRLKVVAEGVETVEQLDFLKECGCDEIQGYYLSKPLPFDELQAFLAK